MPSAWLQLGIGDSQVVADSVCSRQRCEAAVGYLDSFNERLLCGNMPYGY